LKRRVRSERSGVQGELTALRASSRVYGNVSPMVRAFGRKARCLDEPQGPALGETSLKRVSVNHSAALSVPPGLLVHLRHPVATLRGMARMGRILMGAAATDNPLSLQKNGA
jgi:hypothetical protein